MLRKSTFPLLATALVLLVVSQSCSTAGAPGKTAQEQTQGSILFSDDFSDPPSGWGIWDRDGGVVEYFDGGLRILVEDDYFDFWSVAGKSFGDVQIEVDAVKRSGPDDNDFGIICRYQNRDNFYMLVASNDGYYGIVKLKNGQYGMIGSSQLQYSDALLSGQVVNHLRADCVGDTLTLYANGQILMEAQDPDFREGDVGLVAGAYKEKGVDILFDTFVVKIPGE